MPDLSHWDFAERFTGYEAAALILGIEPRDSSNDESRVNVVMERLKLDYSKALQFVQFEVIPFCEQERKNSKYSDGLLFSVDLERLWFGYVEGRELPLDSWLSDKRKPRFENQSFDRGSLARWLKYVGLKTAYRFDMAEPQAQSQPDVKEDVTKPLSSRERKTLLAIIGILCKEANIDYKKHAKAAGLLKSTAASMGVSIGESTIEEHLKKVGAAVADLMP